MLIVGELAAQGIRDVAESITAIPAVTGISGLECSVISRGDIADLKPARPFRLHLNLHDTEHRLVPGDGHDGDPALTLHYEVARTSGITIWGAAAREIFPAQPRALLAEALISELQWATEHAEPFYAVLNTARAWAFAHEGEMLSKIGGWMGHADTAGPPNCSTSR